MFSHHGGTEVLATMAELVGAIGVAYDNLHDLFKMVEYPFAQKTKMG